MTVSFDFYKIWSNKESIFIEIRNKKYGNAKAKDEQRYKDLLENISNFL